jgi:membrane protease YdiL (CAAX protease family)
MTKPDPASGFWRRLPTWLRAIVLGLLIAMLPANIWLLFLASLGAPLAAILELIFLALYIWWLSGGGRPTATRAVRATAFRRRPLSAKQWTWGLLAAVCFAATVHAAIVVLFRLVPYPAAAFRQGYDLSSIPSLNLKWLVVVISAASAGICEETGFRGYLQRPMEQRYGARVAILTSSLLFTLVHLNKGWATAGMIPIVFGAGGLLGLLAWSSESLIPGMVGHTLMDVGLFAFWWTGIAGNFTARPIGEAGVDRAFVVAFSVMVISLLLVLLALSRLRTQKV